jgi:hypothetical protein
VNVLLGMLKDARNCPRRFWQACGLILFFVAVIAWSVSYGTPAFAAIVAAVGVWGIFTACMTIYQVGQHVAYKQAQRWAEDARSAMFEIQSELQAAYDRYDRLNQTFEGPS